MSGDVRTRHPQYITQKTCRQLFFFLCRVLALTSTQVLPVYNTNKFDDAADCCPKVADRRDDNGWSIKKTHIHSRSAVCARREFEPSRPEVYWLIINAYRTGPIWTGEFERDRAHRPPIVDLRWWLSLFYNIIKTHFACIRKLLFGVFFLGNFLIDEIQTFYNLNQIKLMALHKMW